MSADTDGLLLTQNFQNPQAALVSRVSISITNKTNVDGSSGTTAAAGVTVKRVTKPRVLNVFSAVVPTGESTPPGMSPFVHTQKRRRRQSLQRPARTRDCRPESF